MKAWLRGFIFSFPVQLVFLHFRKYQVLLLFWFILFSTVGGSFMSTFGAGALYLAPEYLGSINILGAIIVGFAVGMFIMSWNISTFILFSKYFRFLSATTNPFLKYCINNAVIPLCFIVFYCIKAYQFNRYKELMPTSEILLLGLGFIGGLILLILVSFIYFFRADKNILRQMMPLLSNPGEYITHLQPAKEIYKSDGIIKVEWYLDNPIHIRRSRDVKHYTSNFVNTLFKRHHFAAILSVFAAFLFLIIIGFFLDYPFFQIPAAASITIFFSILIGVAGAFSYFLQSWAVPYLILLIAALNLMYKFNWIDPRNKAYGLNYNNETKRPSYSPEGLMAICGNEQVAQDKANMITILEKWKAKQGTEKPVMVIINTSGGGHRSATFTMRVLQKLDSLSGGNLMTRTFLINGASGGMIGATYYRELYKQKMKGAAINLNSAAYIDNISNDLLNSMFSSFVARDILSPAQKFKVGEYSYIKDRGYAFEQKLNSNTHGLLNHHLGDYVEDEREARIPLIFFNSVITRDSRKMLISTQPVSFMMRPLDDSTRIPIADPDVIDFVAFFKNQDPYNLRMLTALRMNATFPIVLPNVWLPSEPVIDVMDAGLRDNYGQETSLRFLSVFEDWIAANTGGVLLLQIRDRGVGGWESPYLSDDISDHATKPFLLLQHNWFKMMEYSQNDILSYYSANAKHNIHKMLFQYIPAKNESKATLNFRLGRQEKKAVISAVNASANMESFEKAAALMKD